MKKTLRELFGEIKVGLLNEKYRINMQFFAVFAVFAFVSAAMTIVNYFTGYEFLMWTTMIFSAVNIINIGLSIIRHKCEIVARWLFTFEIFGLFLSFLLNGEPQGFSILWCLILPMGGMLLYRRRIGAIISAIELLIIIFFFWIPFGQSLLPSGIYSESFMLRFPFIYITCFAIGFIFEYLRSLVHKEMLKSRDLYMKLSYIDPQTGLGNEHEYMRNMQRVEQDIEKGKANFAIVVFDINNLKRTNDIFGHRYGSFLIVEAGRVLPTIFAECTICHVGGDEFVAFVPGHMVGNVDKMFALFEDKLVYKKMQFEGEELTLSLAGGFAVYKKGETYKDTFQRADKAMYKNKAKIKKTLLWDQYEEEKN